jgi:hypothetical protein
VDVEDVVEAVVVLPDEWVVVVVVVGAVVVVLEVELVMVIVVGEVDADVPERVNVLDPVNEEDVDTVMVLLPLVVVVEGWKRTWAVSAPATITMAMPTTSTMVPNRPTRAGGFFTRIFSLVLRSRANFFCLPLHHGELGEA